MIEHCLCGMKILGDFAPFDTPPPVSAVVLVNRCTGSLISYPESIRALPMTIAA